MSDFQGNEELLADFMVEALELLSDVDNKLLDLEKNPDDLDLLNNIFRDFHTIKGGAGFLEATEMVTLCHHTENLFDQLRHQKIKLTKNGMDVIFNATSSLRNMFDDLSDFRKPGPADSGLLHQIEEYATGISAVPVAKEEGYEYDVDWETLYHNLMEGDLLASPINRASSMEIPKENNKQNIVKEENIVEQNISVNVAHNNEPVAPAVVKKPSPKQSVVEKENSIRVDTNRLDLVLNLSGEIGLTRNRLNRLKTDLMIGKTDPDTIKEIDLAVSQMDLLVGNLQNAVMKTRMQPVGRLFQKYPRMARDLARQLGKDIDLEISGEETELDKTMIEELADPLVHLIRNAVDHGMDTPEERRALGKDEKGTVYLRASQVGGHILIQVAENGRGMNAEVLKRRAVSKGLIDESTAHGMSDQEAFNIVFLPGFSTKEVASNVSGRGVGMDVVKSNIEKLSGRIEIESVLGQGTTFTLVLPLTLAILPVLVVRNATQLFAVPLANVREVIQLNDVRPVSGAATLVLRNEVLPVRSLTTLLGWNLGTPPKYGVLLNLDSTSFILAVDHFVGREDVVIKPVEGVKPPGVSGATISGSGEIILILDLNELLKIGGITQASLWSE